LSVKSAATVCGVSKRDVYFSIVAALMSFIYISIYIEGTQYTCTVPRYLTSNYNELF
jgi:hypothetical protein